MDAQLPRIAEGLDHLRLLRQVFVLAVLDVALVDEGLEVAAVLDAVGRVEIDHLHLACHAFLLQQAVHHQQRVAGHEAVGPAAVVLVELDGLAPGQRLLEPCAEEVALVAARRHAFHALADDAEDGRGVDALVHVQADGVDREASALGLARPLQVGHGHALQRFECLAHGVGVAGGERVVHQRFNLRAADVEVQHRVEVRVIRPAGRAGVGVGVGRDHAHFRIVFARFAVPVRQHRGAVVGLLARSRLRLGALGLRHRHGGLLGPGLIGALGHGLRAQAERVGCFRRAPHRAAAAHALHQPAGVDQQLLRSEVLGLGDFAQQML